jgi:hypothetical protein
MTSLKLITMSATQSEKAIISMIQHAKKSESLHFKNGSVSLVPYPEYYSLY